MNEAKLARQYSDEMLARTIGMMTDGRRLGSAQVRLLAALKVEQDNR